MKKSSGFCLKWYLTECERKFPTRSLARLATKTAWDRLKKEFGQTLLVVNSHVGGVVNLETVVGSSYGKVEAFYEKLSVNYDALRTLHEHTKLDGFVMCTLNKLPQVEPDLVRTDDDLENWSMEKLIDNMQSWLRRNKSTQDHQKGGRRERNMYVRRGGEKDGKKCSRCVYCKSDHWSDKCKAYVTVNQRKNFFVENKLCFNCASPGHRGGECRECFHCGAKHHTSLCSQDENGSQDTNGKNPVLTGYTSVTEEPTLRAIIPVKLNGQVFREFLDTGSGLNIISREAAKKLNLRPVRHERKEIVTVNSSTEQSMPVFEVTIESLDGKTQEDIELSGSKLNDFTTIRRPDMNQLKHQFEHTKNKRFYMNPGGTYPIHMILGDKTYVKIRTEEVFKGNPGDPAVEGRHI